MGKWCLHASSFIFDGIIIKVAGNQDRHKSLDEFDFEPLVSMAHLYVFEMRFDLGILDSGERSLPFGLLVILTVPRRFFCCGSLLWDLIVSVPDHCLSFYFQLFWYWVRSGCSPVFPLLWKKTYQKRSTECSVLLAFVYVLSKGQGQEYPVSVWVPALKKSMYTKFDGTRHNI